MFGHKQMFGAVSFKLEFLDISYNFKAFIWILINMQSNSVVLKFQI